MVSSLQVVMDHWMKTFFQAHYVFMDFNFSGVNRIHSNNFNILYFKMNPYVHPYFFVVQKQVFISSTVGS